MVGALVVVRQQGVDHVGIARGLNQGEQRMLGAVGVPELLADQLALQLGHRVAQEGPQAGELDPAPGQGRIPGQSGGEISRLGLVEDTVQGAR